MSSDAPTELNTEQSILFLGSGFSSYAKNILGRNLVTGRGLKSEFAGVLGVKPDDYDLKYLADEIGSRSTADLYHLLYNLFTVKELHAAQAEILNLPWQRIYTTNYDDSVEFAYHQNNKGIVSYNYNDEKPRKLLDGAIIHLHGVIRATTEDNVLGQIILNESAYIRQHFEKSPWYDDFDRDLRFCSACFFVGYDLSDYHIAALLLQNPEVRAKTYFVTRKDFDQIFANRVKPFGTILPIEVDGFAKLCSSLPKQGPISDPHLLSSFRYLDPFKDRKTLSPPTTIEVQNLVTYGTFNYQRCLSTLPDASYVVPRRKLIEESAAILRSARCLLVHSRLGNGKTIFMHILAHKLTEQGYQCFWCRPNPLAMHRDFEYLKRIGKVVVLFDSYNTAIDFIEQLTDLPAEAKFGGLSPWHTVARTRSAESASCLIGNTRYSGRLMPPCLWPFRPWICSAPSPSGRA